MKRPLALIGFTYFLSLLLTERFDLPLTLIVAALLFLASAAFLFSRPAEEKARRFRYAALTALLTAGVGCCVSCACRMTLLAPADSLSGREYELTGVVFDRTPEKGPYCARLIRVETLGQAEYSGRYLRVLGTELYEAECGDYVRIRVRLEKLSDAYSGASYRSALAQGIRAGAESVGKAEYLSGKPASLRLRVETALTVYRTGLADKIRAAIPGEAGALAAAVSVGDKSGLSREVLDDFRVTGTRHLLALSGFHLSLLVGFLLSAGLAVAIPRKLCYTIVILLTAGYMAMVGFPYSIQRAGIMTLLTLAASLFRRSTEPVNSLGAALLLICLLEPGAAYDVGLQLSASSTLGILLLSAPMAKSLIRRLPQAGQTHGLYGLLLRLLRSVIRSLCASLGASAFSLPILLLSFGEVSLIGPLATLLVGWLLPFLMLPALAAGLLRPVVWLSAAFGWVSGMAGTILRRVVGVLADIPFVCVYLKRPYVFCWLGLTAAGLLLLRLLRTRRQVRRVFLLLSAVILLAASLLDFTLRKDLLEVVLLDGTERSGGVLLSAGGSALYAGPLAKNGDVYDIRSMLTGQTLDTLCLFNPDDRVLRRASESFPGAEQLPSGDGAAGVCTLGRGTLYLLNDTEGHAGAYYEGISDVLLLSDGFRAADLPAAVTHPSLLVLMGGAEQPELLMPDAACLLGDDSYALELLLRTKGAALPEISGDGTYILRASTRGEAWRFSSEPL